MKKIYFIGGPMGVGKTTACKILKNKLVQKLKPLRVKITITGTLSMSTVPIHLTLMFKRQDPTL